jgi:hypothetical protein
MTISDSKSTHSHSPLLSRGVRVRVGPTVGVRKSLAPTTPQKTHAYLSLRLKTLVPPC